MIVKILGSAAGGGFPQWNCACANCRAARAGAPGFLPRTQCSVAVSADGRDWLILNASPDIRAQIEATPSLRPAGDGAPRGSPIKAVAIANADVDAIAGLLTLRESQAFTLLASRQVLDALQSNVVFNVLDPLVVDRRALTLGGEAPVRGSGVGLGLTLEAFAVPGKVPLYLERADAAAFIGQEGDTIGLKVAEQSSGVSLFFIPGCARLDAALKERLAGADLLFFDGTLFSDAELLEQGLTTKTGGRMGHMSIGGPAGSLAAFSEIGVKKKIYVHINNSNPVLNPRSRQRAEAEAAGWTIGEDGMTVSL